MGQEKRPLGHKILSITSISSNAVLANAVRRITPLP